MTIIVIVLGFRSIERRVCDTYARQDQTIAKQLEGIAYCVYLV
jgi:hypothetical protein